MDLAIFSLDGVQFLLRWMHFIFGVIWIGLLYYFNFVQGAFMAEADAGAKSNVLTKLLPRALWWFRWGAMWTMVSGLLILMIKGHMGGFEVYSTSWGASILLGAALGLTMWFNVWFVIWPNQKIVIQSATQVAGGGQALPEAAGAAARALVASRTNTCFSIPMLFFMGAASHLAIQVTEASNFMLLTIISAIIIIAMEVNVFKGKTGPMTTIKGVIHCGLGLAVALYAIIEFCL